MHIYTTATNKTFLFMHSFKFTYLWSNYYLPGIFFGTENTAVNTINKYPCFHGTYILVGSDTMS